MNAKKLILASLISATVMASTSASASYVTFFFAEKGTTTQITDKTIGGIGTTFDLTLCMKIVDMSFPVSFVDTFVGFDQTNKVGDSATPLLGKIGLNGTLSAAVKNPDANFMSTVKALSGGETPSGAGDDSLRPYGVDVNQFADLQSEIDFGNDVVKLFDISLKNLGIGSGGTYTLVLWDAGTGALNTSLISNTANDIYRPGNYAGTLTLHTAAVPEPASMIALGLGASALLMRRRKR